jgi:hypothetical protein
MMPTSADPSSVQYGSMIPQLTTHMSTLQLGTGGSVSFLYNMAVVFCHLYVAALCRLWCLCCGVEVLICSLCLWVEDTPRCVMLKEQYPNQG